MNQWLGPNGRLLHRYAIWVNASTEGTFRAAQRVTLRELPVTRLLFRLRGLPFRRTMTLREFFSTPPFLLLEEDPPHAILFGVGHRIGASGRRGEISRRPASPEAFRSFTGDGTIRALGAICVTRAGGGAVLSTETWIATAGTRAAGWFRLYWLVIGPFSGRIRREILHVVKSAAEHQPTRSPA